MNFATRREARLIAAFTVSPAGIGFAASLNNVAASATAVMSQTSAELVRLSDLLG
jgi:hypothetical protein